MIILTLAGLVAADPVTADEFDRWMDAVTPATIVVGEDDGAVPLEEMLEARDVPGAQVVLIDDWKIVASRSYGLADVAGNRPVTNDTRFQAASISKPVAALAMLSMVEDGELDLDRPVNEQLTSWQVPAYDFEGDVTLRGLLSHTAGTSVSGFPGYGTGVRVPSIHEVLDGAGNTDPVRVTSAPGSEHRYSGGGFTLAELTAEDVAGHPFEWIAFDHVLEPLGMTHSSYALGAAIDAPLALAYSGDGSAVEGGYNNYPEQAAAGLWTTSEDLAAFALALGRIADGQQGGAVSPEMAQTMLTAVMADYGLGIGSWEQDGTRWFGHGGSNRGYKTMLRFSPDTGEGIAIMTNGDRGSGVFQAVIGKIADEMGWKGMEPRRLEKASLDADALQQVTGTYRFDGEDYVLKVEGDGWILHEPDGATDHAIAIVDDRLYFASAEQLFDINRGEDGEVVSISLGGAVLPRVGD